MTPLGQNIVVPPNPREQTLIQLVNERKNVNRLRLRALVDPFCIPRRERPICDKRVDACKVQTITEFL